MSVWEKGFHMLLSLPSINKRQHSAEMQWRVEGEPLRLTQILRMTESSTWAFVWLPASKSCRCSDGMISLDTLLFTHNTHLMHADMVSMVIVLKLYVICPWLHFYRFMIPERTDKPTHTKHKQSIMAPLYNSNNRTMLPLYRYLYPVHYADFTPHL